MPDDLDTQYYLRREAVSRALADKALDAKIRQIHMDFADAYAAKAGAAPPTAPIPMRLVAPMRMLARA